MIYLDNAATTFKKPPSVYKALDKFYSEAQANPGRSSHKLSCRASEKVFDVREKISSLYSLSSPESVVFTYNATYALNIAIKTTVTEKCHIITSDVEHNSVMRVIYGLCQSLGVEFDCFDSDNLSSENLKKLLRSDTKLIISTLASNVTGKEIDEALLSDFARRNGLQLIIDASQATGHRKIDLRKNPCDILCAPGHKALFGLMGSGFCVFGKKERGISFIEGGSGNDSLSREMPLTLPEGYEGGTLGVPAIIALGEGIDYVRKLGEDNIQKKLKNLTDRTFLRLREQKKIRVLGKGSGIISFVCDSLPSDYICQELDRKGILVRGGLHCAPSAHKKLNTLDGGAVRASFSIFNNEGDVETLYKALKDIIK